MKKHNKEKEIEFGDDDFEEDKKKKKQSKENDKDDEMNFIKKMFFYSNKKIKNQLKVKNEYEQERDDFVKRRPEFFSFHGVLTGDDRLEILLSNKVEPFEG